MAKSTPWLGTVIILLVGVGISALGAHVLYQRFFQHRQMTCAQAAADAALEGYVTLTQCDLDFEKMLTRGSANRENDITSAYIPLRPSGTFEGPIRLVLDIHNSDLNGALEQRGSASDAEIREAETKLAAFFRTHHTFEGRVDSVWRIGETERLTSDWVVAPTSFMIHEAQWTTWAMFPFGIVLTITALVSALRRGRSSIP